jgi:GNAT superfamily N-acetyltransferase
VIREAQLPGDAADVAAVYISSARHHAALDSVSYHVPGLAAVVARYERWRPGERASVILVADVGGRLVGAAEVRLLPLSDPASMLKPVPTASIDVAVLEDERGKGLGEQLMTAAHEWAVGHGAERFQLNALAANRRALEFYRDRLGYEVFGVLLVRHTDR